MIIQKEGIYLLAFLSVTARAKQVFDSLSPRVVKQIQKLAAQRGETLEQTVERAVALLAKTEKKVGQVKESDLLSDPVARATVSAYLTAARKRAQAKLTPAELSEQGKPGGTARAKKLSPEARKKIASDAAKKRWEKQTKSE